MEEYFFDSSEGEKQKQNREKYTTQGYKNRDMIIDLI